MEVGEEIEEEITLSGPPEGDREKIGSLLRGSNCGNEVDLPEISCLALNRVV